MGDSGWRGGGAGGLSSWEHIKKRTLRGWGQLEDPTGKESSGEWRKASILKTGELARKRVRRHKGENKERVETFGCDESEHCNWSRTGREGSRGRKQSKEKRWHTVGPYQSDIFVQGGTMCGNRFSNIENKLSARRGGPLSANILDFSVTGTNKDRQINNLLSEEGRGRALRRQGEQ